MADPYAGLGTVVEGPKTDPYAGLGKVVSAVKAPAKGRGSERDPYRIGSRYKIGSPEYKREVARIPVGAYYSDPQGNLRQKENASGGNPVRKRNVERDAGWSREVTGFFSNLNRGLLIGDEGSAALGTAGNLLAGKIKPGGKINPAFLNPLTIGLAPFSRDLGNDYENQLAKMRAYEDDAAQRRPWVSSVARTTGMVPTLFVPGGAGAQATTRGGAIANAAGTAALQAGTAGLLDRGTYQERANKGTVNALIAAPLGGVVAGLATRTPQAPKQALPTVDDMAAKRTAAYQAADQAGVRYTPQGYDDMVSSIEQRLADARMNPTRHPKAASMLAELKAQIGHSPTLTELDQIRQVIRRDVASATDQAEAYMGQQMIRELDAFIANAGGPQVMTGSGANGAALIGEARKANTQYRKFDEVTNALGSADLRTASTGSGGNIDNAIRQNMRRVYENGSNWTPEEEAAILKVIRGTPGQNVLRQVGKLSPQGNGLMASLNLGAAAFGGPLGAAPGAAGLVSKHFADKATQTNVTRLLEVIAQGGPQANQASQQILSMPGGQAFFNDLIQLGRASGAGVAAANQNSPATAATAIR
jgi:hypothetical protein